MSYESHGGTSSIETLAEDFVQSLKAAIQEDASTIRETDLDRVGGFLPVVLCRVAGAESKEQFVDKLGRVVLPATYSVEDITGIIVDGSPVRDMIRAEPRFEGERQVAWVCYLAERETNVEAIETIDPKSN